MKTTFFTSPNFYQYDLNSLNGRSIQQRLEFSSLSRVQQTDPKPFFGLNPEKKFYAQLDHDIRGVYQDAGREVYRYRVGLQDTNDPAKYFDLYTSLKNRNTLQKAYQYAVKNPSDMERNAYLNEAATLLNQYVSGGLILNISKKKAGLTIDVSDLKLEDMEGNNLTKLSGDQTIFKIIRTIQDNQTRSEVYNRYLKAFVSNVQPLQLKKLNSINRLIVSKTGLRDSLSYYEFTKSYSPELISAREKEFIEKTNKLFLNHFKSYFENALKKPFNKATRADAGLFIELEPVADKFQNKNLFPVLKKVFNYLGCNDNILTEIKYNDLTGYRDFIAAQSFKEPKIFVDLIERPKKTIRAFLAFPNTPVEMYIAISTKGHGGMTGYSALLHEGGHGFHFLSIDPKKPFMEVAAGQDNALKEAYAHLIEGLIMNPYFLKHELNLADDEVSKVVYKKALNVLYLYRRTASKTMFEIELAKVSEKIDKQKADELGALYEKTLTEGTGLKHYKELWTDDLDELFTVGGYAKAQFLTAKLEKYLRDHFGTAENNGFDWYKNPNAGEFLRDMAKPGLLDLSQWRQILDYDHDDVDILVNQLTEALEVNGRP